MGSQEASSSSSSNQITAADLLRFSSVTAARCSQPKKTVAPLSSGIVVEYAVCAYHCLVTVAGLCLVCIMFAKKADGEQMIQHRTDAYVMAPSGGCLQWGNGECISQENSGNAARLWGLLHMEERKAVGLFSSTNAAVVCLTAQIVAMCLTAANTQLKSEV